MPEACGIRRGRARRSGGSPPGRSPRARCSRSSSSASWNSRKAAAARRDATSPACAPPMPSATAKSGGSATKESSFRRRLRPASVTRRRARASLIARTAARSRRSGRRRRRAAGGARSTRSPFTQVPFVESRSTSQTPSRAGSMRAWWPDAYSSPSSDDRVVLGAPERDRHGADARAARPAGTAGLETTTSRACANGGVASGLAAGPAPARRRSSPAGTRRSRDAGCGPRAR